jgi:hypothetical protein
MSMRDTSDTFEIKQTGTTEYGSGYKRDRNDHKVRFSTLDPWMLARAAAHMTKAIPRYGRDNWRLSCTKA